MYDTCPKCGHTRSAGDKTPADRCPACGVLFEKWLRASLRDAQPEPAVREADREPAFHARLGATLLHVEPRVNPIEFWVRVAVWLALAAWGIYFIGTDWVEERGPSREIGESFMHRVNLVFHEAGHVIFIPFGEFMSVLGGSLGQLLMPLAVVLVFLFRHHNTFGAAVGLWWLAQSLMDLAPYIGDARAKELMLLGGITGADAPGSHDWANLLARTGLIHLDRTLASAVDLAGEGLMLVAIGWGGVLLLRQHSRLESL